MWWNLGPRFWAFANDLSRLNILKTYVRLKRVFRNRRFRDRDVAIVTCIGLIISVLQLFERYPVNHSFKCPVSNSKLSDNLMKLNRIIFEWENEYGRSFWVLTTSWALCPINVRYPFPVWIKIRQLFYFRHFCICSNCFFVDTKIHFRLITLLIMKTLITLLYIVGRVILKRQLSCPQSVDQSGEARHGIIMLSLLVQSHLKSFGSKKFQEWSLTSRHYKYKQTPPILNNLKRKLAPFNFHKYR
jgi:hypothetical protein